MYFLPRFKLDYIKYLVLCLFSVSLFSCKKQTINSTPSPVFYHIAGPADFGSSAVFACVQDSSGNIWVGMEQGVAKYDGHNWTTHQFFPLDGSANELNTVRTLHVDHHGNVWAGVENNSYVYAFEFDGTGWINEYLSGSPVSSILEFPNGDLWFLTQQTGTYVYQGGNWTFPACECGGSSAGIADATGKAYVAQFGQNAINIYSVPGSTISIPVNYSGDGIYDIGLSGANGIITASYWGCWKFQDNIWTNITPTSLYNEEITAAFQDSKSRIWIGTTSGNVFLIQGSNTTELGVGGNVSRFMETRTGEIYASTNGGLYEYK